MEVRRESEMPEPQEYDCQAYPSAAKRIGALPHRLSEKTGRTNPQTMALLPRQRRVAPFTNWPLHPSLLIEGPKDGTFNAPIVNRIAKLEDATALLKKTQRDHSITQQPHRHSYSHKTL
jgi:hypothetical protein